MTIKIQNSMNCPHGLYHWIKDACYYLTSFHQVVLHVDVEFYKIQNLYSLIQRKTKPGVTWFNAHLYPCLRSHRQGSSLALLSSAQITDVLYTPCTKALIVECLKSSRPGNRLGVCQDDNGRLTSGGRRDRRKSDPDRVRTKIGLVISRWR